MTEPNIVYIGDEVRHISPCWDDVLGRAWVTGANDRLIMTHAGGIPKSACVTPDDRPVDGFGGAKIENPYHEDGWAADIQGVEIIKGDVVPCGEAINAALFHACRLYGEWVREPTEADLKRRGLL